MGFIHLQLGDLERAKEYQDRVLAIRLKKLGPDDTDVATSYSHLGLIYLRLGDLERAKKYAYLAFAIRLKKLGPDHSDVASDCSNLSVIHQQLGDLERAKEYHDRALAIMVRNWVLIILTGPFVACENIRFSSLWGRFAQRNVCDSAIEIAY